MRKRPPDSNGFTLLELVVVLAILAVVTTLALRSLGHLEDQKREEANREGLRELRDAVLGSPNDRAVDGSPAIGGFVADMGRLPRAVEIDGRLTLSELWLNPGAGFDVRQALAENGVPAGYEDGEVLVSGGWRGPYLRLPIGAGDWLDGWGNPMVTPLSSVSPDPDAEGYARLRDAAGNPLTAAGQDIRAIWHLGANGTLGAADAGYDRDGFLVFADQDHQSDLTAQVEVMDEDEPAVPDISQRITLVVFSPDPADASKIEVRSASAPFTGNPVVIPKITGLTHGHRVVRAYFHPRDNQPNTHRKSAVRNLRLRPGANFVELRIDR